MTDIDEKIPNYKPLPKGSKFAKANADGQVPKDCVNFNWGKDHCWIGDTFCDCKVLKGEFCDKYIYGGR